MVGKHLVFLRWSLSESREGNNGTKHLSGKSEMGTRASLRTLASAQGKKEQPVPEWEGRGKAGWCCHQVFRFGRVLNLGLGFGRDAVFYLP